MPETSEAIGYSTAQRNPFGDLRLGSLLPAIFSLIVVQLFRADIHNHLGFVFTEIIFFVGLVAGLFYVAQRSINNPENRRPRSGQFFAQVSVVAVMLLTIGWQVVTRTCFGVGDANEIIALLVLQYAALCLAVFSAISGYERLSLVLNSALVFFVCCMTDRWDLFLLGGAFAVAALWWLLGLYWSRLDNKAVDAHSQMLLVHGSSIGIVTLIIALIGGLACLVPLSGVTGAGWGIMPFSGGDHGYSDEFARAGIGDGDMLTGGKNAQTTGPVDSDQFIEDDKPSLYDMISDTYDDPIIKQKRRNRAVALSSFAKHMEKVKQSEVSGRSFRTLRDSNKTADLENRVTDALFFVEGSVPARFRIGSYHHFDGVDWEAKTVDQEMPLPPRIVLKKQLGKPIFKLFQTIPDYLTSQRFHRVKMMRLETPSLPSPQFLNAWHIAYVDNESFFRWSKNGQVRIDGELIPPQTLIDIDSYVPNYHIMRKLGDLRKPMNSNSSWWPFGNNSTTNNSNTKSRAESDSLYLQIPANESKLAIEKRVTQWTEGIEPGWNQVEAIVNRVRNDFELNPTWDAHSEIDDTVANFLDQQGGPTYMFATTCAMALRSAGYKTRLSNGFVVRKEDYSRVARQSEVTSENIHIWPEVCLDGRCWIPVEPTPGYPVPYSTQTFWQWVTTGCYLAVAWMISHPITSVLVVLALISGFVYRAELVSLGLLGWWHVVRLIWPAGLLTATRQLIDARFWMAGDRRPDWQTIRGWYRRIEPALPEVFFDLWNAKNYSDTWQHGQHDTLVACCREQVQLLTLRKIKDNLTSSKHGKNDDT